MQSSLFKAPLALFVALAAANAASVVLTPANESIAINSTRQYTAAVTGLAASSVVWSINGTVGGNSISGLVSATGLYTAPTAVPAANPVTIQAKSTVDATVFGTALITVKLPGPALISVSPSTFQAANFSLKVTGTGFVSGAVAYLNGVPLSTAFVSATQITATGSGPAGNSIVNVTNPGSMYSNYLPVTLTSSSNPPPTTLTLLPLTASVIAGATQQFTASAAVTTWSVTGGAPNGTVSPTGLYSAPATVPNPAVVTINAAGANNTSATAKVTVLSNQPPAITSVNPSPIPVGVFTVTVNGAGFSNASQAALNGKALPTQFVSAAQLTVIGSASQSGAANLIVANGALASAVFPVQIGPANPLVSAAAARRFLEQSAFGPTPAAAAHVQQVGFQAYLAEQFALPPSSNFQGIGNQSGMSARFLTNAVMQPDQLRQRAGFALSQILVTSINKLIWTTIMAPYQDLLLADAFANYRQILGDVTLSAGMGYYLDMGNSGKGNASGTVLANENYAREILQLFSLGTTLLNIDGTQQLDGMGNPIPTYTQSNITEFARVFTGWTYAPAPGKQPVWNTYLNAGGPMVPIAAQHDTGAKTLLNGKVLPANQTAQQDLSDALDNIFAHPNMGPFIAKQMIQHLVKSAPSPAYVARVAAAFNNTGGVRGDMKAVISAVLLDSETRQNDAGGQDLFTDGHMQEPALFIPGMVRAFNGQMTDQNYYQYDLFNMNQDLYNAPSVFNYYAPGAEMQIYSPYTSIYRDNLIANLFGQYSNQIQSNGPGTTLDLTPYAALASSPAALVDALDITLTHGTMPAAMKQTVLTATQNEAGGSLRRAQTAAYLILASSYYNVWH